MKILAILSGVLLAGASAFAFVDPPASTVVAAFLAGSVFGIVLTTYGQLVNKLLDKLFP